MTKKMNRREFIRTSASIGAGSVLAGTLGTSLAPSIAFGTEAAVDVGVVQGEAYLENTKRAVRMVGGIGKFVPGGSKVAVLANPQKNNPGAFTSPEVLRGVLQLCKEAGAGKIGCISWIPEKSWVSTGLKAVIDAEGVELVITDLKDESRFRAVPVPKGVALKEARIMKTLDDYDLFIDVPVTKDHSGNKFTGTLKNLMGLNSPLSNRAFHKENWKTDPGDIRHLDQCIADLNTVVRPALCIVDATEFIVTNGPFGPGKLHKPMKVVAGTDRVAMDAYCATLWGLTPQEIHTITMAHSHGLGEIDLKKVSVKEAVV